MFYAINILSWVKGVLCVSGYSAFDARGVSVIDHGSITFPDVFRDTGEYNITTGMFTCSIPGFYWFSATIGYNTSLQNSLREYNGTSCYFLFNDSEYLQLVAFFASSTVSFVAAMSEGDQLRIGHCYNTTNIANDSKTHFSGMLIRTFDDIEGKACSGDI